MHSRSLQDGAGVVNLERTLGPPFLGIDTVLQNNTIAMLIRSRRLPLLASRSLIRPEKSSFDPWGLML
jgi:hypothetical protein